MWGLSSELIIKIVLIVTGVVMLFIAIGSLAKRKMNESFCLAWFVVSIAVIVAGCVIHPARLSEYISVPGIVLIFVIFYGVLYAAYYVSIWISELSRKNQELAIQVSLLNQENERILRQLSKHLEIDVRDL